MIFVTVGTQLPFDRLSRAVDNWCKDNPDHTVFGQLADPGPDGYRPVNFEWEAFIGPAEFNHYSETADMIVAHAGMGSIITALTLCKPILIMPRHAALGEQRNDHQLATAAQFGSKPLVHVAENEDMVPTLIEEILSEGVTGTETKADVFADAALIERLKQFIDG